MEWDKALAEILLEEPEIRSWLGLDSSPPRQGEPQSLGSLDQPPATPARPLQPAVAA